MLDIIGGKMVRGTNALAMINSINEAELEGKSAVYNPINLTLMIETIGKDVGMVKPSINEYTRPILFTGEKLRTKLAVRNIITAETARILILRGKKQTEMDKRAIKFITGWLSHQCIHHGCNIGECAHSSAALLRYCAVNRDMELAGKILNAISERRDGNGRWNGYPFFYTLLSIAETQHPLAQLELKYALDDNSVRIIARNDGYALIRRLIINKASDILVS
jgi:hypothetical protein